MQLADVIRSFRSHWRASVGVLVLGGVLLALFLVTRNEVRPSDKWVSSVKLLVPAISDKGDRPDGVPPSLLQGQDAVALSIDVREKALNGAGLGPNNRKVSFNYVTNESRDIATLTATAPDRETAITLSDAYAEAYVQERGRIVADGALSSLNSSLNSLERYQAELTSVEKELRASDSDWFLFLRLIPEPGDDAAFEFPTETPPDVALLFAERRELLTRIAAAQQSYADSSAETVVPQSFAQVVERPLPVQITPDLPSAVQPIGIALGVTILLALALPLIIDRVDQTIRDARSANKAFDTPVLSAIPASTRLHQYELAEPGSKRDAAYRALAATSIATDSLPRAIVVTSPIGEIQDGVAANFAAALAGLGLKVALVPTQDRQDWFLELANLQVPENLPDVLALAQAGQLNGQVSENLLPTSTDNLWVLAAGSAGDDALLEGMPTLLDSLAHAEIDVTVIAGPALLEDPAATILAWSTRSVLWVVESGSVTEREAHEASNRLGLAGASAFGVTLVDAKT